MGKALYRKYRSRKLSEIVGQEHVTTLLETALQTDRIAHAYLFTGPRGVGKTSIARILAYEINELPYSEESSHLDIIEIDAASNNGVDDIRDLREKVTLAPTSAKKKVYIIDEVHMLSKPAFNALLKTLEEPPEHVVFILATTDVDKLPDTIISRTQRHTFRRANTDNIIKNLSTIAKKEKIPIEEDALRLIASHSDGNYRDSVSLLDQLSNTETTKAITAKTVESALGLASTTAIDRLMDAVAARDFETTVTELKSFDSNGVQATVVATQLARSIQESALEKPELLDLLDNLLDVSQSSSPSAKLLAVLGTYAASHHAKRSQSRATVVTPPPAVIAEPLPELAKKATEEHPIDDIVSESTPKPSKPVADSVTPADASAFQSDRFLQDAKEIGIGLHSLLAQSTLIIDENSLIIYAKKAFNKKRLESAQNTRAISDLLAAQNLASLNLIIEAGSAPSKNSQVAAVAAIMGGGEEITTDEVL